MEDGRPAPLGGDLEETGGTPVFHYIAKISH